MTGSGAARRPGWVDIGTGGWDRQGRPSEVRVNRIIGSTLRGSVVGAILDRGIFERVTQAVRAHRA